MVTRKSHFDTKILRVTKVKHDFRYFLNGQTGQVLTEGEILKRPAYAQTLRDVAQYGAEAFYNGTIGDRTVEDIRRRGGIITKEDLSQYRHVLPKLKKNRYFSK